MRRARPNLFSIAPGAPFLTTLADAFYQGALGDDFALQDPADLAQTLIYVPTRRAARTLRAAFVEKNPHNAGFLPSIRALGDSDEERDFFTPPFSDALLFTPPIPTYERLMLLAEMVRPWREKLPAYLRALYGAQEVVIPASSADAIWLARELARLMDEMEREGGDWTQLETIAPDLVAEWWQVTLEFLKIIREYWPKILESYGFSNPVFWRNAQLLREAERLELYPPLGPVIAAGSTGSMPATAALLKTIAFLPKGAVVLPGLDRDMDDSAWKTLSAVETDPSIYSHPQFGLKRLLEKLGATRDMVTFIGHVSAEKRVREAALSEAMRPADVTDSWAKLDRAPLSGAFSSVALIEAASEREEALAVACALRAAIEDKSKTAALVTGDRNLARRVAVELQRFGIEANDSGGRPLLESAPVALIRLFLESVFNPGDPVVLLSLIKHPLTRLGQMRSDARALAENFELFALRGGAGRVFLADLASFVDVRIKEKEKTGRGFDLEGAKAAKQLAENLVAAVRPLLDLERSQDMITLKEAAEKTIVVFENIGRDIDGSLSPLYESEAGHVLIRFFRHLISERSNFTFKSSEWPAVLEALMADETVRPGFGGHPRLFIWGALEARLQHVDTLVIAGLNEGSFPSLGRNDPFLSRTMKATLSLEPPEGRIGSAAHDFQMMAGQDHVILSRSLRVDSAPSVPSRWLQRLETVLGENESAALRKRGAEYVEWARLLDEAKNVPFISQPMPVPPLNMRPKHFSVTEIETLRRDPYAIYAKKVLRLSPLDDFIREPSFAERGTLYHAIVAGFVEENIDPFASDALTKLMAIAHREFHALQLPPDVEAIWWLRFEALAGNYITWEKTRPKRQRFAEISANAVEIDKTGVTLSGRADRIDIMGQVATIFDFKTGSSPSVKQAATLIAPQLALEGALLMRGAFADCGTLKPDDLLYVRLKAQGEVLSESVPLSAKRAATELSEEAWNRLGELIAYYQNPAQGYRSRALPPVVRYEGDYDHLARVLEWSSNEEGGEE